MYQYDPEYFEKKYIFEEKGFKAIVNIAQKTTGKNKVSVRLKEIIKAAPKCRRIENQVIFVNAADLKPV